jgi:hypothetical protein
MRHKSFVDDLSKERGIVSGRVASLLRFAEIKPLFSRFVSFLLLSSFSCVFSLFFLLIIFIIIVNSRRRRRRRRLSIYLSIYPSSIIHHP